MKPCLFTALILSLLLSVVSGAEPLPKEELARLESESSLAADQLAQGKLSEAAQTALKVATTGEKTLGADNAGVLVARNILENGVSVQISDKILTALVPVLATLRSLNRGPCPPLTFPKTGLIKTQDRVCFVNVTQGPP